MPLLDGPQKNENAEKNEKRKQRRRETTAGTQRNNGGRNGPQRTCIATGHSGSKANITYRRALVALDQSRSYQYMVVLYLLYLMQCLMCNIGTHVPALCLILCDSTHLPYRIAIDKDETEPHLDDPPPTHGRLGINRHPSAVMIQTTPGNTGKFVHPGELTSTCTPETLRTRDFGCDCRLRPCTIHSLSRRPAITNT